MKKWQITLYILFMMFLSGGLMFAAARQKSFSEDEAFTSIFTNQPISELSKVLQFDVHPPMYIYMANIWGAKFGYDEVGLRSMSILFAMLSVLLTYKFAKDLLGETTAIISTALMAFSPLLIMYGHNARYYSLALFLALLVAWSCVRYRGPRYFIFLFLYVMSGSTILYLLFGGAAVLIACNLWWVTRWFVSKNERFAWSLFLWITAQVAIILLYLPGFRLFSEVTRRFSEVAQVNNWMWEIIKRVGYTAYVFAIGETISPLSLAAWIGIVLVIGISIYAILKNWQDIDFWLLVIFFFIIIGANLLATLNAAVSETWQNLSYRALYAIPFLIVWLGSGLAQMKLRYSLVFVTALLLVYCFGIFNYFSGEQFLRPVYTVPWREIFSRIQQESTPDALVICGYGDSSCYYYAHQFGYQGYDPGNWGALAGEDHPEIWFIQTNLGRQVNFLDGQNSMLDDLSIRYPQTIIYNYAQQDRSIRWIKQRLMGQEDYEYRINLIRFY